ncbi:GMC oxidoreductase [Nesidiocoris tenuis]|uniref:GMC oxidoreductase n=1 Tax=Nesidiocoris tenuis TaxID=355587 RepID=A0ABN7AIW4_9HEMI|nr:GMC oxidoreductase [Nesidiocoris tenuis]
MAECECRFEDTSYLNGTCGNSPNVTMLLSLVDLLIRSNCHIAQPCKRSRSFEFEKSPVFDFIVVGGGVAGPVVASRLSDNKKWRVALMEAGPEEPSTTMVPAFSWTAIGTSLDWKMTTEPTSDACLSTGGVCSWPRGKMLGGTGSMSGSMYNRGNKEIFNNWAREGNIGWTYYETLPFFKKSERNLDKDGIEKLYHGTKGPMPVSRFPWKAPMVSEFLEAGKEIGYDVRDLNGANQTGISIASMMFEDGVRVSAPRAYLRGNSQGRKKNLYIMTESTVTRVIINEKSKRAIGVEYYTRNGVKKIAYAKKEVILTAGTVNTPKLLMLSGVGRREVLVKHNIPVISDLKVGENLHNHVGIGIPFSVKHEGVADLLTVESLTEYLENRTGPLASTGLTQLTAFMHTKYSSDMPDIQMFFDGYSAKCPVESGGQMKMMPDGSARRIIYLRPTNILPKSKGYLTLKSSDPFDPPLIYPNYLSDIRDVQVLIEGIRLAQKLTRTEAVKKWDIQMEKIDYPACDKAGAYDSDQYWECMIRHVTGAENHPAGSARMGILPEIGSVVDPELRVYGVPNLRVMDASVFPYLPNGNPIPAIIMVAEKGSHLVEKSYSLC